MNYPQDPTQPAMPYGPPPPPPRRSWPARHKILTVLGAVVAVIVIASIATAAGGGSDDPAKDAKPAASTPAKKTPADPDADPSKALEDTQKENKKNREKLQDDIDEAEEKDKAAASKVTFKVWGTAPAGVEITYGNDGSNLDGGGLPMTKTMKFDEDAMYYAANAQLMGGGDIHCSVTVDGETKTSHAKGGYNICTAQLSNTGLGWD